MGAAGGNGISNVDHNYTSNQNILEDGLSDSRIIEDGDLTKYLESNSSKYNKNEVSPEKSRSKGEEVTVVVPKIPHKISPKAMEMNIKLSKIHFLAKKPCPSSQAHMVFSTDYRSVHASMILDTP